MPINRINRAMLIMAIYGAVVALTTLHASAAGDDMSKPYGSGVKVEKNHDPARSISHEYVVDTGLVTGKVAITLDKSGSWSYFGHLVPSHTTVTMIESYEKFIAPRWYVAYNLAFVIVDDAGHPLAFKDSGGMDGTAPYDFAHTGNAQSIARDWKNLTSFHKFDSNVGITIEPETSGHGSGTGKGCDAACVAAQTGKDLLLGPLSFL